MKRVLLLNVDKVDSVNYMKKGSHYSLYLTENNNYYAVIREYQPGNQYPMEYTSLYHYTLDEVLQSLDLTINEEERNKIADTIWRINHSVVWEEDDRQPFFKLNPINEEQAKAIADKYLNSQATIARSLNFDITPEEAERVNKQVEEALKKMVDNMNNRRRDL